MRWRVAVAFAVVSAVVAALFPLVELEQIVGVLRVVLVAGVATSTVLGFGLGRWASRRALRPLTELTVAAGRVARGDLRARLPEHADADLPCLPTPRAGKWWFRSFPRPREAGRR